MKHLLFNISLISLCAFPAFAQTPPKPQKKNISPEYYQQRLQEESKQQTELKAKLQDIETDLQSTKKKLVKVADSIQDNEKELENIEQKTASLEKEQSELQQKLDQDRVATSKLITALERIRRVPPQALIARPEAPLKTAQSAMLLSDIIPVLTQKAQELQNDLKRQDEISAQLKEQKDKALARSEELNAEQKQIASLLNQREDLYKQTRQDFKVQEIEVQKISRQSRNLKDLVEKLEDKKAQEAARAAAREQAREAVRQASIVNAPVKMPAIGSPRLPISGVIKTRYQDTDKFGAKSEGIRIEGRSAALVVAPMAGIIRFAGPFKNYDNMAIIEHEDGYHSLIAGLEKVDALVGQSVNAGEPLGKLKSTTNGAKPALYYELRYKGRAIDPARKFADLG